MEAAEATFKVVIMLVLVLLVAFVMAVDPVLGGRVEHERSIVLGTKLGCVVDPVSLGRYCTLKDEEGLRVSHRGY